MHDDFESQDDGLELRWPSFEGGDLVLSEKSLLEHVLVIGSSGSGKSCFLDRAIAQLIAYKADDPDRKVGLLIIDAKNELVPRIRELARRVGRQDDVAVIGHGEHRLNMFPIRTLADVDAGAQRLLAAGGRIGGDNEYWEQARYSMLDAALTLLVCTESPVRFRTAMKFMRDWFFDTIGGGNNVAERTSKALSAMKRLPPVEQQKVESALDAVRLYRTLDPKTRSNVQSTLINTLRPLCSIPAAKIFDTEEGEVFNVSDVPNRGRICIVACNAISEPCATLTFKLAKGDFFQAIQQRLGSGHRHATFVADELPLVLGKGDLDSENLATIRTRCCSWLSGTQGLINIDSAIGVAARRSLFVNFGTVVFMRTREREVDDLAATQLGTREEKMKQRGRRRTWDDDVDFVLRPLKELTWSVPVCPQGALGRLAPHQAYVVLSDGTRKPHPLWFVPWYEEELGGAPANTRGPTLPAGDYARALMRQHGCLPAIEDHVFGALLDLCKPNETTAVLVEQAELFFQSIFHRIPRGLNLLPGAWLKGLPGILAGVLKTDRENPTCTIDCLNFDQNILCMSFAQELKWAQNDISKWDGIRMALNLRLYPSLWCCARPRHLRLLKRHPRPAPSQMDLDPDRVDQNSKSGG